MFEVHSFIIFPLDDTVLLRNSLVTHVSLLMRGGGWTESIHGVQQTTVFRSCDATVSGNLLFH